MSSRKNGDCHLSPKFGVECSTFFDIDTETSSAFALQRVAKVSLGLIPQPFLITLVNK